MSEHAEKTQMISREKVIVLRVKKGWSQRALAKRAGVYQGTVSKVERGEMFEKCEGTRDKLAKALGVKPEELNIPPTPDEIAKHSPERFRLAQLSRPKSKSKPLRGSVDLAEPTAEVPAKKPKKVYKPKADDNPLVAAIIKAAAHHDPLFGWHDIKAAIEAALESGGYLPATGSPDLPAIARAMLDSARANRMKEENDSVSPMAVLATAFYHKSSAVQPRR